MSTQRIITCSTDTFRMFIALCKSDDDEKDKKTTIFSTRTPAFFLAAAIGIINNKSKNYSTDKQLTRREYIIGNENYTAFELLIRARHALKTEQDIITKLAEYAEYGISELYDEYHKTGDIDFVRISRHVKSKI